MSTSDRDLSAEARRAKVEARLVRRSPEGEGGSAKVDRDRLDAAIDQVASRLVAVPDDGEMTLRIVSVLPERTSRLRWLIPQFAAIGALAIGALVWATRTPPLPAPLASSSLGPMARLANVVVANGPETGAGVSAIPLRRLQSLEPWRNGSDHERSLAPIEAATAFVMPPIMPPEIPATELLTIAPIDIGELPMTAESFSQRK